MKFSSDNSQMLGLGQRNELLISDRFTTATKTNEYFSEF
jgi:hypothetical protein